MEILIISAIVVVILSIGFLLIPFLKKKELISNSGAKAVDDLLVVAQSILNSLNINSNTKDRTALVFNIANIAVKYVEQTLANSDNASKKQAAYDTIISILGKMKIDISDDIKSLIEIGIEAAVNALPKTYEN